VTATAPSAGPDQMRAALTSMAGQFVKDPTVMQSVASRGPVTNPQALMNILRERATGLAPVRTQTNVETTPAVRNYRSDLIAIITHPSNPVQTLTVDQVRKLFSGECTNWSAVGGPALPVKLVTSRDGHAGLEDLLHVTISADAIKVPFLSYLFVGIAEMEGAVGFLPTSNVEQLEFVRGHGAIKKIAIKKNTQSPALSPTPTGVVAESYPLLARYPK
jgi:phosphate transport system substrate-binding protein